MVGIWDQCEQVPGAMTQGRTIEEVRENLKEAITLLFQVVGNAADSVTRQRNSKEEYYPSDMDIVTK